MDGMNWISPVLSTMTATGNGTISITASNIAGAKFARLAVNVAAAYSSGSYTIINIGVNAVN